MNNSFLVHLGFPYAKKCLTNHPLETHQNARCMLRSKSVFVGEIYEDPFDVESVSVGRLVSDACS
jgi:hypothetical protein